MIDNDAEWRSRHAEPTSLRGSDACCIVRPSWVLRPQQRWRRGRAFAQALTPLRATSAIDDPATPFLYAMESGLFRKNGFDASLERATSGAAAASAVVGGSFDVGKSSVISLLSAHVRGLPIVAVAAAGDYDMSNPTAAIAVRADSAGQTGADLNGKIVAVSALNDLFSIAVRAWVDAHGGDSTTLKLIELPTSAVGRRHYQRPHRCRGDDPAVPFSGAGKRQRPVHRRPGRSARQPPHRLGLVHDRRLHAERTPDAVLRFMRTMRDAAIYVNGHHAETAHLLTKFAMVQTADVVKLRTLQGRNSMRRTCKR